MKLVVMSTNRCKSSFCTIVVQRKLLALDNN